jgi:hypothetical protein
MFFVYKSESLTYNVHEDSPLVLNQTSKHQVQYISYNLNPMNNTFRSD